MMDFVVFLTPIEIFSSTLSESFISPEELAHIAAPFRDDGLPDDLIDTFSYKLVALSKALNNGSNVGAQNR